ncbi:MAG: YlzJ-like family protein [Mycobacterium leprae]
MIDATPSILWTVMPLELALAEPVARDQQTVEVYSEGRLLSVLPNGDGTARVVRLISAAASDYLDPRWQPGASVPLNPSGK